MKIARAVPVLGLVMIAACTPPPPKERMQELDRVYVQGQAARKQMISRGQPVDDKNCDKTFVAIGEDRYHEDAGTAPEEFIDLRKLYFRNGCLNLPKPGTVTPSAATGTAATPITAGPTSTTRATG